MTQMDLQAERVLALSVVADPATYDAVSGIVDETMFADELAGRVFDAVVSLLLRGQHVSAVSVQAHLVGADGKGGSVMPQWNKGRTVSPAEAVPVAHRIREMWARRQISTLALQLSETQDSEKAVAQMAEVQARIQFGGKSGARSMLQLTAAYVEELQADMADPSRQVAFETGYRLYDKHTGGLRPGVLTVLAARPGSGKSSFVVGMAAHLARTGIPVGVFWLEDDWRDCVRRYFQTRHGVDAVDLRGSPHGALNRMNAVAAKAMDEQERIFVDDTHGMTITDIAARMRRMHREHGCRVFFADHLGEIAIDRDDRWGDRHDLALGKAARTFRDTAKALGAAPVLCSQMNRNSEKRGDGSFKLSDLDGSGQVEQAARVVAFLHRPLDERGEPGNEFHVDLKKNTNGQPGLVKMRWIAHRMAVENMA